MPLSLIWLVACTDDGAGDDGKDSDVVPDYDPAVEIGTGEDVFEPVADGGTVYVVFGPQGGYHLLGSLRAQGIVPGDTDRLDEPTNPVTTFRVFRDGAPIDTGLTYQQGLDPVPGEPGIYSMIGRFLILDITDDAELDGVELEMEVEVTDADGVVVTDRRRVVGEPHPLNDL